MTVHFVRMFCVARSLSLHLLVLTLIVSAAACRKKERLPPEVIAQAGDRTITLEDFKHYLKRNAGSELTQIEPQAASALLDQHLEEAVVSNYAAAHGVEISAERIADAVRSDPGSTVLEKRDQMRRLKLVADINAKIPQPTDEQVEAYYRSHLDEFNLGERVHARQILVHDEAMAKKVVAELEAGKPFEEVSKELSSAPNAQQGGDIGVVGRGQLPRVFEDVLFNLAPGAISRPIQTDSSFHIFRVDDYQRAGQISLPAATPLIRTRLKEEAIDQELDRELTRARAEVPVSVLAKRLPFEYSGAMPVRDLE